MTLRAMFREILSRKASREEFERFRESEQGQELIAKMPFRIVLKDSTPIKPLIGQ